MHSNTAHNSHAITQAGVVIARSMVLRITLDEVGHQMLNSEGCWRARPWCRPLRVRCRFLLLLTMSAVYPLVGQSPPASLSKSNGETIEMYGNLPVPTGDFKVGRITTHWTDTSRIEPLSPNHDYRVLMVDIWYPAESSTDPSTPYLDTSTFERALGTAGFRSQFRDASEVILEGVKTHAIIGAPFAGTALGKAKLSPVLIFSPGAGMAREMYTAQMELQIPIRIALGRVT